MFYSKLTLHNKILLIVCLLGILTLLSVTVILKTVGYDEISKIEERFLRQKGETVVAVISQNLAAVERLVTNMARLSESLPKSPALVLQTYPHILGEKDSGSFIAGGGIWPEPYTFDQNVDRSSFFWGRDRSGNLNFFNDYNNPLGNGYTTQEWYAPGRYLRRGQIYWSRSYVDPFSIEPMVTATTPYFSDNGEFSGVSTVDVKLQGLNRLFAQHAQEIQGYIFALDRNDVFLSFPVNTNIRPYESNARQVLAGQYSTIHFLADKNPAFEKIAGVIKGKGHRLANNHQNHPQIKQLSQTLANQSYQIDLTEAQRIIADITTRYSSHSQHSANIKLPLITIPYDTILHKKAIATVHYLALSHWYVVVVSPLEFVENAVNHTTQNIVLWQLLGIIAIILFAYLIFYRLINIPFRATINLLQKSIDSDNQQALPVTGKDELSQLAKLFNERTAMLETARKDADEANQSKSQFLSRISHELRTPLNAIIGFSQLLMIDKKVTSEQLSQVAEIEKAGIHLLALINDVMNVSKIDSGELIVKQEQVDIEDVINESIKLIDPLILQRNIIVKIDRGSCKNANVIAGRVALKQVMTNLLSNAAKYNKEQGEILILSRKHGDKISIDIKDTGAGIPQENLKNLYEPFNRLGREYTGIEGTGIGLSITKQLVEAMNGTISVHSTPGIGTTFSITLAACMNMEKTDRLIYKAPPASQRKLAKAKILMVEDLLANQKVMLQQLQKLGYQTEQANDGIQALGLLMTQNFDLILTDCMMPGMDGYELARRIRAYEKINDEYVPIIAITAKATPGQKEKCICAGMDDCIIKSVDFHELEHKIIYWLQYANQIK